jgi:hypothetical protein
VLDRRFQNGLVFFDRELMAAGGEGGVEGHGNDSVFAKGRILQHNPAHLSIQIIYETYPHRGLR